MKKLMYVIGLGLISGSVWAACLGGSSFCYDDSGTSINGQFMNGNGWALPAMSSNTVVVTTPTVAGQVIVCTSCGNAVNKYAICVATSNTNAGNYIITGATNAAVACR